MRIFVTGASGFLGTYISIGLRREGHRVHCLVRDESKGVTLTQHECEPLVGDLDRPDSFIEALKSCDVVVHCASGSEYERIDRITLDTFKTAATEGKLKRVIFTSGILVCAPSDNFQDEDCPTDQRPEADYNIARAKFEQEVRDSTDYCGVVVRPAYVYGLRAFHFKKYFEQAIYGGPVVVGGKGGHPANISWSEVHIDDLVDGYVRIVAGDESTVRGCLFHFADSSRNTNLEIATAYARIAGFEGAITCLDDNECWPPCCKTVLVSCSRATELLGWHARKKPMLEELDLYFRQWVAYRQAGELDERGIPKREFYGR